MTIGAEELAALARDALDLAVGARVENVHVSPGDVVTLTLYQRGRGKGFLLFCLEPELRRFHFVAHRPPALAEASAAAKTLRRHLARQHIERLDWNERGLCLEFPEGLGLRVDLLANSPRLRLERGGEALLEVAAGKLGPGGGDVAAAERTRAGLVPASHARVAARYADVEKDVHLEAARQSRLRSLTRARRRQRRLVDNLLRDRQRVDTASDALREGELLKSALGSLKRGMTEVEIPDYYAEGAPLRRILLDPRLSPIENVERRFRRYKKRERALPIIAKRLARAEDGAREIASLRERVAAAESIEELSALDAAISRFAREKGVRQKGAARTARAGPRRFVSADGIEILVGRNARGNDELTFRIARGNDLFLHASGVVGSHVIVRAPVESVPPETLIDAAHLAVYYSGPRRDRVAAGGEVDYTSVKHLRRVKGGPPGRVLFTDHRSLRVRWEPERFARLRGEDADPPRGESR